MSYSWKPNHPFPKINFYASHVPTVREAFLGLYVLQAPLLLDPFLFLLPTGKAFLSQHHAMLWVELSLIPSHWGQWKGECGFLKRHFLPSLPVFISSSCPCLWPHWNTVWLSLEYSGTWDLCSRCLGRCIVVDGLFSLTSVYVKY